MRELRNTDLIQISILDQDRQLAADITNTIAEEYQRRRIVEQQDWVNRSLIQLQGEVDKQRGKVDDLRETAARIRVQYAINDLNPESAEDPMQATERVLLSEEEQVNNERLKVTVLRAKQDQVSQMTDDQIMRSTRALDIEDPTILQVFPPIKRRSPKRRVCSTPGWVPITPPSNRSVRERASWASSSAEQIRVLRKTLADNFMIAEDQVAELETGLDHSRALQQESKTRASAYFVAKNEYIQAKKLLEAAEMRLSTETMQRTMPQSPVTIWERAEPSQFPARPRVFLNIALSVLVGLVFGLGLAFFVEHLDTSVKTVDDVQTALSVPVLAVIPRKIKFLIDVGPGSPRCGSLSHPANEHRVWPEVAPGQRHPRHQRRARRRKIHHRRQSRLHLRPGRIPNAPRRRRHASINPGQDFRRRQRKRLGRLPIIASAARRGDPHYLSREFICPPQWIAPSGGDWDSQLAADGRLRRGGQEPL